MMIIQHILKSDNIQLSTNCNGPSDLLLSCPLYGHCYGFHIIPAAKGCKDPWHSLVSYLEKPPEVIFYDFACSSQYCLNRESADYKKVRFAHDILYLNTRKCSSAYKSAQLQGFERREYFQQKEYRGSGPRNNGPRGRNRAGLSTAPCFTETCKHNPTQSSTNTKIQLMTIIQ